jgi:Fe-S oxidoreductase
MEPITRPEFLYFSLWEKLVFYLLAAASLWMLGRQIVNRVKLWMSGRPTGSVREGRQYWMPTKSGILKWGANVWTMVLLQKKVRSSRPTSGAPMHLMMFYGFSALFLATTLLSINTYSPVKFHQGNYFLLYEATFDTLGLLLFFGLIWAIVRRAQTAKNGPEAVSKMTAETPAAIAAQTVDQRRYPISHGKWDSAVLWLLLLITANGYLLEAARIAANPKPFDTWSWVGHALAQPIGSWGPLAYKVAWWFHIVLVLGFFVILPRLRIRHILMAIISTAGAPDTHMGKLRTIPMEEVEETEIIGVKHAKDYSRWHLMSLDACMECGRCTEVCPAWNVGKILNPKQIVQDLRGAMVSGAEVVPSLTEEALWQCTTCNACVEACPVLIRHVDIIVDARRNMVSEGQLSGSGALMLRQTASTNNAWGTQGNREDWMKGMEIPLCRDGVDFEYLFWVGCAGATDPSSVKTTKAVAELLTKAGVKFACLGNEEACTGDPARRLGEEFLFQEKAMDNATKFERYGVKKVVTACPHCFNSLKNEYGDFGAKMEVFHHTQLLQTLVSKGNLLAAKPEKGTVVMHDPCYLGRVNDESEAPRALVEGMINPEFHGAKTRCCGAGGGRMWMEEPPHQRPANARVDQLLETGATTIALGCPFCKIMLDASVKQARPNDEIRLVDLAEMLQEANQTK